MYLVIYHNLIKTMTENRKQVFGVYLRSILTTKIYLHVTEIGKGLEQTIIQKLIYNVSNKCIQEGYISPNNIKIVSRSSGVVNIDSVMFHIVYECEIAHPVEGMVIYSKVKTLTKAGIHAHVIDKNGNIPINIFVARDHNLHNNGFNNVKEGDNIYVKVIGTRYELNDPYVSVIATMVQPPLEIEQSNIKPKISGGMNNETDLMNEVDSNLFDI